MGVVFWRGTGRRIRSGSLINNENVVGNEREIKKERKKLRLALGKVSRINI